MDLKVHFQVQPSHATTSLSTELFKDAFFAYLSKFIGTWKSCFCSLMTGLNLGM